MCECVMCLKYRMGYVITPKPNLVAVLNQPVAVMTAVVAVPTCHWRSTEHSFFSAHFLGFSPIQKLR